MNPLEMLAHLAEQGTPPRGDADMIKMSAGLRQTLDRVARETLPFVAAGGSDLQFVFGPYGRGKTHYLKAVAQWGREHGFVTAYVDGQDNQSPFRELDQTYRAIADRMTPPGKPKTQPFFGVSGIAKVVEASFIGRDPAGLREVVDRVRDDRALAPDFRNLVLAYCTEAVMGGGDEDLSERLEALLAATSSYRVTLGELYRMHGDLPRPLGKLSRRNAAIWLRALLSLPRVLGFAGLLVLFDETETALARGSLRVSGPYGAGKTHLLTMLASLAAREGLATASALLDGEGVTLADPMTILEPVLRSLCLPGESTPSGVGRWLAELRRRGSRWDRGRRRWSRIAEAVFQMPVAAFDDPDVLEALEDYLTTSLPVSHANLRLRRLVRRPLQLPSMRAQRITDRAERFCELLRDWAEFCEAAGARGLVVVFDEVDVEYAATLWHVERRTRRQLLLHALNNLLGQSVPLMLAFGSAPATDQEAANDAARDITERMSRIQQVAAPQPNAAQIRELGRRLCALYSRAYPKWVSSVDERSIERAIDEHAERYAKGYGEPDDPAPRRFVRELFEWMDVASDRVPVDTDEA